MERKRRIKRLAKHKKRKINIVIIYARKKCVFTHINRFLGRLKDTNNGKSIVYPSFLENFSHIE